MLNWFKKYDSGLTVAGTAGLRVSLCCNYHVVIESGSRPALLPS